MLITTHKKIILASTSKIRNQLLQDHNFSFQAIKPYFDEDNSKHNFKNLSPNQLALELAKNKALSVSEKFFDCYVIGSDQVCEFDGQEISKSKNRQEAIAQLQRFSGKEHYQNNATVVALNNQIIFEYFAQAKLTMHNLEKSSIEKYVDFDQSWNCAGSYKYEGYGKYLFSEVKGDYFAILGLSIQPLISFFYNQKIISF